MRRLPRRAGTWRGPSRGSARKAAASWCCWPNVKPRITCLSNSPCWTSPALLDQSGPTWQTARPAFAQRALGVGAQILRDLGARKLRMLGVPVPYRNIAGFELEVTGFVPPG
ncbi:hypothetical protein [Cupriavidus basilensis]|uniref:hypothetical protein n=1 Tax=Cupriavidus basilensis TaxID=68895 RepID=UPI002351F25D|nr:hypothetical protein [Cupriavidus basilensis]